jgi:hypothetical protein
MSDLNVKSDSVDVEQIMKQIRSRIREKRGSDYTETELQQLASAKFEQFADPSGLRSDCSSSSGSAATSRPPTTGIAARAAAC